MLTELKTGVVVDMHLSILESLGIHKWTDQMQVVEDEFKEFSHFRQFFVLPD